MVRQTQDLAKEVRDRRIDLGVCLVFGILTTLLTMAMMPNYERLSRLMGLGSYAVLTLRFLLTSFFVVAFLRLSRGEGVLRVYGGTLILASILTSSPRQHIEEVGGDISFWIFYPASALMLGFVAFGLLQKKR